MTISSSVPGIVMPVDVASPADEARWSNERGRSTTSSAVLALCVTVGAIVSLGFAEHFAVNWIYIDDLSTLTWFKQITEGTLGPLGLLDAWDNQHPLGAQIAILWLTKSLLGLNVKAFVCLTFLVVLSTACLASLVYKCTFSRPVVVGFHSIINMMMTFHLAQVEHLLWSFELGWFLVNLCIIATTLTIERMERSQGFAFVLCLVATFSSAQGALVWVAAAIHYALMAQRGRARSVIFLVCGAVAIGRIALRAGGEQHPVPLSYSGLRDLTTYFVEIVGGSFGSTDHRVLFFGGVALLCLALILLWSSMAAFDPRVWRPALVWISASLLSVASFSQGRSYLGIDWATTSFHAAPLLVPFYLGVVALAIAPMAARSPGRLRGLVPALIAVAMLLGGWVATLPYGLLRARLWAMDQGYAKWVTCRQDLPLTFKAKAAGVGSFPQAFADVMDQLQQLCTTAQSPIELRLTREPEYFLALGQAQPELKDLLSVVWQDYATDPGLQRAFPINSPETPVNILAFIKSNEAGGLSYDTGRLSRYATEIRSLNLGGS